jgi:putative hydrolase of the HAD superfamily
MKALLLDALGTMIELPAPAPALREELAGRFGIAVTEEQAARAMAAEIAFYRDHFDAARDPPALDKLRGRCAEVLRAALPASPALAAVGRDELVAALLGALRFRAYPDARPAILDARRRGLRVVAASNWDISLGDVLERIGLAPLLDGVISSAGVGARKPDGRLFGAALELAEASAAEAVHVGDSPIEDVRGALAAGLRAVLIRRHESSERAGIESVSTISSLAELGPLI